MVPFMLLTRDQARALDQRAIEQLGVPGIVLMENAGRGMAELLLRLGAQERVVICCGKGNNAGDGFVIARHLDNAGIDVRVLLFADPRELQGDAAVNYHILKRSDITLKIMPAPSSETLDAELASAGWIVDALFGSGLQGPVRPPFDRIIAAINASAARVFAVDIPSGLDADTGWPLGPCVRAHHTGSVAGIKKGFVEPRAVAYTGEVHIIDMGAPRKLFASAP